MGFRWAGHLLYTSAGCKDSLCVVLACRLAAPQGRACTSPLPMVLLDSAPHMLASWLGRPVESGAVLALLGAETTADWLSVAVSTGLVENLLFLSGSSKLGSVPNKLFIKTLDTD